MTGRERTKDDKRSNTRREEPTVGERERGPERIKEGKSTKIKVV